MVARVIEWWDDLRSSWWFVPLTMSFGAVVLSFVTTTLDARFAEVFEDFGLNAGGAQGTRSLLETVASSMITVAGVSFSIAIVVMTLASSQFGPRVLRTFMRDVGNQVTLGTFLATFLFSVLGLRTVRGQNGGDEFVPHLSVTVAVLLTLASLAVFIYFIHHSARSIQASQIIAAAGRDLDKATENLFPGQIGSDAEAGSQVDTPAERAGVVSSEGSGYVEMVDGRTLLAVAKGADLLVELEVSPGSYVIEGVALAHVWPAERMDEKLTKRIRGAVTLGDGDQRREQQDMGYALDQLAQICLRALSPAFNDPLTANMCIDRLAAGMAKLARAELPNRTRVDDEGRARVLAPTPALPDMLETAFGEIRRSARSNVAASLRLLYAFGVIGSAATRPEDVSALRAVCRMVVEDASVDLSGDDLARLREAQLEVLAMLDAAERTPAPVGS
ncbi:DUF2254 domain-containing protein [soil metagenome]